MNRGTRAGSLVALTIALAAAWTTAMAQTPEQDRQREYWRQQEQQREEQQRRAQEEMQRQQRATEDARKRQQQLDDETTKNIEDHSKRRAQAAPAAQNSTDMRAERPKLLALPPLPADATTTIPARQAAMTAWFSGSSQ